MSRVGSIQGSKRLRLRRPDRFQSNWNKVLEAQTGGAPVQVAPSAGVPVTDGRAARGALTETGEAQLASR